jgi:hypothetical protein
MFSGVLPDHQLRGREKDNESGWDLTQQGGISTFRILGALPRLSRSFDSPAYFHSGPSKA